MPFTPFHLGPALLVGLLLRDRASLPAILAGSVLVDVRATLVFFDLLARPLHGPLHTFVGAAGVAVVIAAGLYATRRIVDPVMEFLRLTNSDTPRQLLYGAGIGAGSHILLDGVLYADMAPFWPVRPNPMVIAGASPAVYIGCVAAGIVGLMVYTRIVFPSVTTELQGRLPG